MYLFHIGLHKVSLGTLILALGLLVDDAIIAVETMAVKLEQGFDRLHAAAFAYTSTAFPMLTGTLVTVSGFLPIALAKSGDRRIHALDLRSLGDRAAAVVARGGRRHSAARLPDPLRASDPARIRLSQGCRADAAAARSTITTSTTRRSTGGCAAGSAGASIGAAWCWP